MDFDSAMRALKGAGSEKIAATYRRHGMRDPVLGVKYGDLGALTKKAGVDGALAKRLWKSGVADARLLATMVADADALAPRTLDAWAKEADCVPLTDALACLVAKRGDAMAIAHRWIESPDEWVGRAGWLLVGHAASKKGAVDDATFAALISRIERGIHGAPNFTRHAMNQSLIGVGARNDALAKTAVAAAKRIGKVEVDLGETACQTPDAASYIEKTRAYRRARAGGASGKSAVQAAKRAGR